MAIYPNLWELSEEAIEEYLLTIRACLTHRKSNGGCLGFPATLLMLCLIDTFGTYLCDDEVVVDGKAQKIRNEPFRVLNHSIFGLALTTAEIKIIEKAFRNRLAHNAMIDAGSWLIPSTGPIPFVFQDSQVGILVFKLSEMVDDAWAKLDKDKIRTFVKTRMKP